MTYQKESAHRANNTPRCIIYGNAARGIERETWLYQGVD